MKTVIEVVTILTDGGAESLVRNYAETINRNEISLIILSLYPHKTSATQKAISQMGIPVISLYPKRNIIFKAVNKVFRRLLIPLLLKRKILQLQPYAIHIHWPLLTYFEPIRDSLKDIRLFYTCHTLPKKRLAEGGKENAAAQILVRDNQLQIIALHKEMAKELNHLLNTNNTIVLNNSINITKYKMLAAGRIATQRAAKNDQFWAN